ncbi:hypothetical protein K438DRAFT_1937899, partial [Mycena galopus ATCC 62051]
MYGWFGDKQGRGNREDLELGMVIHDAGIGELDGVSEILFVDVCRTRGSAYGLRPKESSQDQEEFTMSVDGAIDRGDIQISYRAGALGDLGSSGIGHVKASGLIGPSASGLQSTFLLLVLVYGVWVYPFTAAFRHPVGLTERHWIRHSVPLKLYAVSRLESCDSFPKADPVSILSARSFLIVARTEAIE